MAAVNEGFRVVQKINTTISPNRSCEKSGNIFEQLINALLDGDEHKIVELLDVLNDDPMLKLIAKIMRKDGAKSLTDYIKQNSQQFLNLKEHEKDVIREHPYKGLIVLYMYDFAKKAVEGNIDLGGIKIFEGTHGDSYQGTQDAFRHMMINAMAARFGLEEVTFKMGIAHEKSGGAINLTEEEMKVFNEQTYNKFAKIPYKEIVKCNPEIDEEKLKRGLHQELVNQYIDNRMDLHNNIEGIKIGRDHSCANLSEIKDLVIEKIKAGEAKIVSASKDSCIDDLVNSNDFNRVSPMDRAPECKRVSYTRPYMEDGIYKCREKTELSTNLNGPGEPIDRDNDFLMSPQSSKGPTPNPKTPPVSFEDLFKFPPEEAKKIREPQETEEPGFEGGALKGKAGNTEEKDLEKYF